jgi:hypothetical protein
MLGLFQNSSECMKDAAGVANGPASPAAILKDRTIKHFSFSWSTICRKHILLTEMLL